MPKLKVVAVVGSKKSGKTTTTESLIKEFTRRGYRVAGVKHVSERDFTIDTPEKDTWKYARAGAKTIVSVADNEVATIEKVSIDDLSLASLLRKCRGSDVVFVEGLKKLLGRKRSVPKIVVVKAADEALNARKTFAPILVFSGPFSTEGLGLDIPYADALKNLCGLADIVEAFVKKLA